MMTVELQTAAQVRERIVAIVQFGPPTPSDGLHPAKYYQVTIDPRRFSGCGQFIRLGQYPADEITGWQRADCIYIVAELAKWPPDVAADNLAIPWFESPALEENDE